MAMFNANILMKELRKASGLTQAQVAEGICSRGTLASLETGRRKPDWFTFKNVMMKLGVDPTLYHNDIVSADEAYIMNAHTECTQLIRAQNLTQLKAELDKIEQDPRFAEGLGRRVYLGILGTYYTLSYVQAVYYSAEKNEADGAAFIAPALECTMELLTSYRPDFDIANIPNYFLSNAEQIALDRLVNIYLFQKQAKKSVEIGTMLLENLEKNYKVDLIEDIRYFQLMITGNIANTLMEELHDYEACITLLDKGIAKIKDRFGIYPYYRFSYMKARALIRLGKKEEGEALFKKCIMFSYGAEQYLPGDMKVDFQKDIFKGTFGYTFDLTVTIPW